MKITLRIPAIAIEIEAAGLDVHVPTPTTPTPDRPTTPVAKPTAATAAATVPDPLAAPVDPLAELGLGGGGSADPKPLSEADVRTAIGAALRRGAERNAITACIQGQGVTVVAELRPDQYPAVINAINALNP